MRHNVPLLLVEDDEIDVRTVERAFSRNRITNPVYVARNGEEALAFLRNEPPYENPADAPRPALILLDINMPVMNGLEFLREAKADHRLRKTPVVVLTTSQEESDLVESYELGVAGYVIKPVDFAKFVEAVNVLDLYWTLSELP